MALWSAEIKELERLYKSFKGQLPDLEKELGQLIKAEDANVILLYSRRCLEVIITDLCECELKRDRGTEPLKGIIDRLNKEKKISAHIASSMYGLNELSTYGTHPKDFDPEQVKPVLVNLDIIIKWYLKFKNFDVNVVGTPEQKSILEGVKQEERKKVQEKLVLSAIKKWLSGAAIIAVLIIAGIISYSKIFKKDTLERLRRSGERISVAVMPFQNMTNDTTWNIWQGGIQNELITYLTNTEELKVRQSGTVNSLLQSKNMINYASITPASFGIISRSLEVAVLISGNINKAGNIIHINTQINDPETSDILKAFQIESPANEELIFNIIDSLSVQIKNFFIITKLRQESSISSKFGTSTDSPEAYRNFVSGNNAFFKIMDYPAAAKSYSQAIAIDSNYHSAIIMLSSTYYNQGEFNNAKKWCLKVHEKRNQLPLHQNINVSWLYAMLFETPTEEIKCLNQLLEIDDQNPYAYYELGRIYVALDQYDKAISVMNKTLKIYKKWGSKPRWSQEYIMLGYALQKTDRYRKEYRLYKKAAKDFPDDQELIYRQAVLALVEGRLKDANNFIEKYLHNLKTNLTPDADIIANMGNIYWDAGILDKAGEHFRDACLLDPENTDRLNNLAYFLIDEDQDIKEGLELADKELELSPDNYKYLHTKGWGLYKQGKYQEAEQILQKSWDLRREKATYDHEAFLHLEVAKKAVAIQNIN